MVMPLLLLLLASALCAADRPNILVIVGDDMGYADVGFHGCKDIPTPHLDALAAAGVRCTNGYVTGPYCSPTRAGLLTGRQQNRFGHEYNPGGGNGLPLTETLLPQHLAPAGYATGMVGKWHLGAKPEQTPPSRGFTEFFGFLGGAHSYFNAGGIVRGSEPVKEMDYTTDAFGREASAFVRKHADQPWFLYLAFNAVHTPMDATDERLAKFASIPDKKRRTYAAMMSALDDNIGRVRLALKESGQEGRTLIFFISDNGGPTMNGVSVNGASNLPLRGSKRTTLEGGIRVPFIAVGPGIPAGKVVHVRATNMDFLPTLLDLAGSPAAKPANPDARAAVEGGSLVPALKDGSDAVARTHEGITIHFPHYDLNNGGPASAFYLSNWKLVRNDDARTVKLYDIAKDRGEQSDLAAQNPEVVKDLVARLDAYLKAIDAPMAKVNTAPGAGTGTAPSRPAGGGGGGGGKQKNPGGKGGQGGNGGGKGGKGGQGGNGQGGTKEGSGNAN